MPGTRKLGRATDSRNAMLRAMVTYLFENGKIETTVTRAKEVRAMAEKMVTLGKSGDLHTKRQIFSYITKEDLPRRLWTFMHPSTLTAMVVTPALSRLVCAAVTLPKWPLSNWSDRQIA